MTYHEKEGAPPILDSYPYSIILTRWLFSAAELGLASYFVFRLRLDLGLLFLSYAVVCAFALLPLIRCVRCYYYGKRCNFGWGVMVSRLFSPVQGESFASKYGYTILFWPLRIIPLGLGAIDIIGGLIGGFEWAPQGIFAIYVLIIFLHRRFYRRVSCTRCHQRGVCPVYDPDVMARNAASADRVNIEAASESREF